jgi:Tfp pilus assembly protein PilN
LYQLVDAKAQKIVTMKAKLIDMKQEKNVYYFQEPNKEIV